MIALLVVVVLGHSQFVAADTPAPEQKVVYLTIDDGPTADTLNKLKTLRSFDPPVKAIMFVLGQNLKRHQTAGIVALEEGHILANHSWDHPKCGELTLEQCYEQIDRTDTVLADTYRRAGIPWQKKYFRFPYGDKGAGEFGTPEWTTGRPEFRAALQAHLKKRDYAQPAFQGITYDWYHEEHMGTGLDTDITFDCQEWLTSITDPENQFRTLQDVLDRLDEENPGWLGGINTPGSSEIIVIHDHQATAKMFPDIISKLVAKKLVFQLPE